MHTERVLELRRVNTDSIYTQHTSLGHWWGFEGVRGFSLISLVNRVGQYNRGTPIVATNRQVVLPPSTQYPSIGDNGTRAPCPCYTGAWLTLFNPIRRPSIPPIPLYLYTPSHWYTNPFTWSLVRGQSIKIPLDGRCENRWRKLCWIIINL